MARKKIKMSAKKKLASKYKLVQPLTVLVITLTPTILQHSVIQGQFNPIIWIWSLMLLIHLLGLVIFIWK